MPSFREKVDDLNDGTIRTIAANIRATREAMGMMQKQVAEAIGAKQSFISHLENASVDSRSGERRPIPIKVLCQLSVLFNTPLQTFFISRPSMQVHRGRKRA